MKKRIFAIIATIFSLCVLIELSQPALQNTKLAWVNLDWLVGRDNFYFKKRQWLADARTVVAAVRFLGESRQWSDGDRMVLASSSHPTPMPCANSTNSSGIGRPALFNRFLMAPADPQE